MITVDYNRGRGVQKNSKNDYVILEQPLREINIMGKKRGKICILDNMPGIEILCSQQLDKAFMCLGQLEVVKRFVMVLVVVGWVVQGLCFSLLVSMSADEVSGRQDQRKTSSVEDKLRGRRAQRKTSSAKDKLKGRLAQQMMSSVEGKLSGRRAPRKPSSAEAKLSGSQAQWKPSSAEAKLKGSHTQLKPSSLKGDESGRRSQWKTSIEDKLNRRLAQPKTSST